MLTLIIGGAASGKSEYAEHLAAAAPGPRVYLATMRRHDAECEARIEKHRIDELCARAARVYVVSNEVFSDGAPYDPGTRRYIELLGALNRALAARADRVVEVVCGIPLIWKGGTTE